jgi:hypothetical protein
MELKKLWNAGTGALKLRGITFKSNVTFMYIYNKSSPPPRKVPLLFDLLSYKGGESH